MTKVAQPAFSARFYQTVVILLLCLFVGTELPRPDSGELPRTSAPSPRFVIFCPGFSDLCPEISLSCPDFCPDP